MLFRIIFEHIFTSLNQISTKTQSILVKNKYKQKQVIIVMVYNVFSSKSD